MGQTIAEGAEISMAAGGYKYQKVEDQTKHAISLGARYSDAMTEDNFWYWFAEGNFGLNFFSGSSSLNDGLSFQGDGGLRLYFLDFSDNYKPFIEASSGLMATKDTDLSTRLETSITGFFYNASVGIRLLNLDPDFFIEFRSSLFNSYLFATEKIVNVDSETTVSKVKHFDLYFNTSASSIFQSTSICIGMIF